MATSVTNVEGPLGKIRILFYVKNFDEGLKHVTSVVLILPSPNLISKGIHFFFFFCTYYESYEKIALDDLEFISIVKTNLDTSLFHKAIDVYENKCSGTCLGL